MLRPATVALLFAFSVSAAEPSAVTDKWVRLATPEFELYTAAGQKKGRETLEHLQQVRNFFLQASPVKKSADFPVRVVEFKSREEFLPYNINAISVAYFLPSPMRDYIATADVGETGDSVATHEYMHLIVRHSGLRIPVWLNEGWADVYASLRPRGKGMAIGDLLPQRMKSLEQTDQWLDFDTLTAVSQASPDYNEASRAGIFYAESWALVHMLYLSPEYSENFGKFVMALHRGKSAQEACQIAWGRSSADVYRDLRSYFERKKIVGRVFETRVEKPAEAPAMTSVSEFDARLMLADLLAATGKRDDAGREYASLDKEQPGRADVARSLGYLALMKNDRETARRSFEKAFDAGDSDPLLCFQLAMLQRDAKQPVAKALASLERAVKSKPDYTEARIQLGLARADARDFPGAVKSLMAIEAITPERASAVYCALAVGYAQTGDFEAAREKLKTCREYAAGPQTQVVEALAAFIEARSKPSAAVRAGEPHRGVMGTVRSVECSSAGNRLLVDVNGKVAIFDLPEPAAVEVTNTHGGKFNFSCGPQAPVQVGVEFAPPRSAVETTVGIVRRLEF